tara:strand:+ start:364 stop:1278 length:915 start_codon:yes stop_codon:yes gene_type:complete
MRILSLFDGISGCRQALKELNIDCDYYSSEIDPYAIQISKANHLNIIQIGDVKDLKFYYDDRIREQAMSFDGSLNKTKICGTRAENFDLLIGGFPCQSFSIAGNQKGFADERGQLFFEALRILKEVKPKYFLFENVASMSKDNQAFISEKLGVTPIEINSRLVTYNQRKRLYWTNIPNIDQPHDLKLDKKDIVKSSYYGTIKVLKDKKRIVVESKEIHSLTARYTDLNGSSRPMIILNKEAIGKPFDSKKVGTDYRMLTVTECERLQGFPDGYTEGVSNSQRYKALGNSFTVPVIKHILKSVSF